MEEAKKIREWITCDVLPQIIKYGEYKIEDIH
jgi:prophage antirepressor-like protein